MLRPGDYGATFEYPKRIMMTREQFSKEYEIGFQRTIGFLCKTRGLKRYESEELAQSAWARAWERRIQWRGASKFFSWVMSIAINLHLIQLRRKPMDQLSEDWDSPVSAGQLEIETEMDAERVLSSVGLRHRRALEFKYIQENDRLSNTERTQVQRAIVAVRKTMSMAAGAGSL